MLHTGIDLHKRDLVLSTVDAAGQLVKTARLRTTRAAVSAYFAPLGPAQRAVVEWSRRRRGTGSPTSSGTTAEVRRPTPKFSSAAVRVRRR